MTAREKEQYDDAMRIAKETEADFKRWENESREEREARSDKWRKEALEKIPGWREKMKSDIEFMKQYEVEELKKDDPNL